MSAIRAACEICKLTLLSCLFAGPASFAAEILKLDFSPPPLERFGKELDAIRQKNGIAKPKLDAGSLLALSFSRDYARPGDRWLEGKLQLNPATPKNARLEVELFALGAREPVAKTAAVPARNEGTLLIDLRSVNLSQARVVATLAADGKRLGVAEAFVSARAAEGALQVGQRIPIRLDVPKGASDAEAVPVTFGVPFAAGALWDASWLRLVNAAGRELPHQKEVTALWAKEGAIKWVRFDTLVVPKEGCFVEVAATKPAASSTSIVRVTEQGGKIFVDTGAASYVLGKGASPVEEIRVGAGRVATGTGTRGLYVVDQNGRVASASAEGETMIVEARGPVAACVRFEGDYRTADGTRLARHITRLEFFAGQAAARVQHTLVLCEDSNKVWFNDIGWELAVEPGADESAFFATAREDFAKSVAVPLDASAPTAWLVQDRHFHFAHDTNHFVVATP
ncbi:MAG: hypothetical protein FJ388_20430, partial [Verrucomicrobia bacterium]|nr:hypothetical protein [Verrucomicrobiota bacterium]